MSDYNNLLTTRLRVLLVPLNEMRSDLVPAVCDRSTEVKDALVLPSPRCGRRINHLVDVRSAEGELSNRAGLAAALTGRVTR